MRQLVGAAASGSAAAVPCTDLSTPRIARSSRVVLQNYPAPPGSCAGAASRAVPSVACHTVVKINGPEDLQLCLTGNDLVAEVFYTTSEHPLVDAINFNSYRVRAAAQTMSLHMAPSRTHATVVALSSNGSSSSSAGRQPGQQQPWQSLRQQEEDRQKAIGVVNVSLMRATPSIATAAACRPGTPFAMITNMAVCPTLRRRGISHLLMQAAIKTALVDLDVCPPFALLLAYKYYEPAMRLYESWGFQATPWVDPIWQEDAEKGRALRQRRVMMMKPLSGPGISPKHLRNVL